MSSNIDRSLDEILATRPRANRRRGNNSTVTSGIRKRHQRVVVQKMNVSRPSGKVAASKIIVSNLPYDVSENMIKDYFKSAADPIRRATLNCGPDGRSRGVAMVEFTNPERAAIVAHKYNGVVVDNRPMKVELVVQTDAPANFHDRAGTPFKIGRPKSKKPKDVTKYARPGATHGRARVRARKREGRVGGGRHKAKSAEELDEEMADYFGSGVNFAAPASASSVAINAGDQGMEDTVL